jgi:hypothetical protein
LGHSKVQCRSTFTVGQIDALWGEFEERQEAARSVVHHRIMNRSSAMIIHRLDVSTGTE